MTPEEYLSADRFPLSTSPGLDFRAQMVLDVDRHDASARRTGAPLTDGERALLAELAAKRAALASVLHELEARRAAAPEADGQGDQRPAE